MSNMSAVADSRQPSAFRFAAPLVTSVGWSPQIRVSSVPKGSPGYPAGQIRPAGQTTTLDAYGNVVPQGTPGSTTYDANNNVISTTPGGSTPVSSNASSYGLIAQGLGTTAQTIASVMQGQNQVQIAQLNTANQQYLANLQSQIALSPNNPTLLGQQLQAQLLAQQIAVASQGNNNTTIVIGLGIVAFAAVYYLSTMNKPATKSVSRRTSR